MNRMRAAIADFSGAFMAVSCVLSVEKHEIGSAVIYGALSVCLHWFGYTEDFDE